MTLPTAAVLSALVWSEELAMGAAALATASIFVGIALVSGPLFSGLVQVKQALEALAQGATALPDIVTLSPTARELRNKPGVRRSRLRRRTTAPQSIMGDVS